MTSSQSNPKPVFNVKLWSGVLLLVVLFMTIICIIHRCRKRASKYAAALKDVGRGSFSRETSISTSKKQVTMYDDDDGGGDSSNVECICIASHVVGLREIKAATNGLTIQNMIGSGQFGVVYHGLFNNHTRVAIKNLFSNRQEEREFCSLAESLVLIRHVNLVKLLGYCAEGPYRMVVHEHVENGNLEQWLHSGIPDVSPLTWNIRMKIIMGIAEGLAYLHEETKPPITHFYLKSSNVLIDEQLNPKISDIGTTKLLGPPDWGNPPTGMTGYIAPEYDSTRGGGGVDEKSDVYSFGVLIMEIVSGKTPIEACGNEIEQYLVDWIKHMVAQENFHLILDPSLPEMPAIKHVKQVVLIAIDCVNFEAKKRPKMTEIVHMLEVRLHELLLWQED